MVQSKSEGNLQTFNTRDISSIQFYDEQEEISPLQVFELLYKDLQPLINHSIFGTFEPYQHAPSDPLADPVVKELRADWEEAVADLHLTGRVNFKCGQTAEVDVRPRDQFTALRKLPNMAHLIFPETNERLILRQSRVHPVETIDHIFGQKSYGANVNRDGYLEILDGKAPNFEDDQDYLIPEPILLRALEEMYRNGTKRPYPRLTPSRKILMETREATYAVRAYYTRIQGDISMSEVAAPLGRHFGNLHSLGLLDNADGQPDHYMIGERGPDGNMQIYNIDPDFMLFRLHQTSSMRGLRHEIAKPLDEIRKNILFRPKEQGGFNMNPNQHKRAGEAYCSRGDLMLQDRADFREAIVGEIKRQATFPTDR